jgi:hypothetical protein
MRMPKSLAVLVTSLAFVLGCGDDKPAGPASSASALAPAPPPESKTLARLTIESSGSATFDMKAPLENIKGTVHGFGGELEVELADVSKTRGKITIDLTTLETHTFGEDQKDQQQTEHARTWLEVGAKTSDDKKQRNKLAEFTLREVLNPSNADVTQMSGDSRNVTLTAKGDFALHGRSVTLTLDLACAFQFEGDKLRSVAIKSVKPAQVNLKAHDIQARDDVGEVVIAKTLELFGTKVADDATVTFELMAKPKGAKDTPPAAPPPSAAPAAAPSAAPTASAKATP